MATSKSRLKILMFAPAFAPFASSEAIVNNKLVLTFINEGWEVDVISRRMNEGMIYDYGSRWESLWLPLRKITYVIDYPLGGKTQRLLDLAWSGLRTGHPIDGCRWAYRAFKLGLKLHNQKPYDVIISRSLPDAAHLSALLLSRKTGLPWIANWNDPSSGAKSISKKIFSSDSDYFHRRFLRAVKSNASWLTFPTDRMKHYICNYLGDEAEIKSSVIPHVAIQLPKEKERNNNDFFTITHAGNLCFERNPEIIFRGILGFLTKMGMQAKFRFLIIGRENQLISDLVGQLELGPYVSLLGPLSYEETLQYLIKSDGLLVVEAPYAESIFLPSKFVDYVQTGRPIFAIAPVQGTLHDIIDKHGGGIFADCKSAESISEALSELYSLWKKGEIETVYGSGCLYDMFSPEKIVNMYKQIFASL